ncbi:hypothetical protein [Empedobacter brevis]|uniref:hypothetical protein n=1 Tax=Empedobacter brevis TaxID=247 RepID=UPI00289B4A9C|nr:hypothetical protein [Empedobacter brevis]
MEEIINYLLKNKEWLFSGIGVTILFGIVSYFKKEKKAKNMTNNPNGLINTNNQSGGINKINFHNDIHNPSNISQKPEFIKSNINGDNVLHPELFNFTINKMYCFNCQIPAGTNILITLKPLLNKDNTGYGMYLPFDGWNNLLWNNETNSQSYYLDSGTGNAKFNFSKSDKIQITAIFNDNVIIYDKIINVN